MVTRYVIVRFCSALLEYYFQVRNGVDRFGKDRYLRTLVQNTYSFHLNEIFAVVQNEYTDWATNAQQVDRFNLQWEASKAITDRLITAPLRK